MSNINQNKDDVEEEKDNEARNSDGQSQILEMIRFDANAVTQQSEEIDAANKDDMVLNSNKNSTTPNCKC